MAGPFTQADLSEHLIPADKKLKPKWVDSLTARGRAEVFSGDQLAYIGMPIGGIGCGQLYFGGDGRLWHWDIFKSNYKREKHEMKLSAMTMGGHYPYPVAFGEEYNYQNGAEVQQGFAIRVQSGDRTVVRTLDKVGFPGVTFRGEYPVGRVIYEDAKFPVKVELEAFSPFIPLNTKDSSLPVTVMRYTVTNTSDSESRIELGGWLQNAVCPYTKDPALGQRTNRLELSKTRTSILSTIGGSDAITKEHGYGSSALTILADEGIRVRGAASLSSVEDPEMFFSEFDHSARDAVSKLLDETLVGGLNASTELQPGESKVITCLISWYFPFHQKADANTQKLFTGRHYRTWFQSAAGVADYIAENRESLIGGTLLWNKTWHDSSLPYWLLDRSMISLDCVATQTFHRFDNGRPWAWKASIVASALALMSFTTPKR